MYHICSDKRSQKSASLIYQGLIKCLDIKPLSEITITDIYHASSISRSTFYRLFDNIPDVLQYECDLFIKDITVYVNNQTSSSTHDFFVGLIEISMQHHALLKTATVYHQFHFIYKIQEHIYQTLCTHFFEQYQIVDEKGDYFLTMLSMSIIGIFTTWVKHGCQDSSEQLFQHLKDCSTFLVDFFNSDISSLTKHS